ncbi:MAG: glycosyltransferase [Opitutae bacterium]|nr:glycosyltransferase [Opitutae bacterium]
MILSPWFFRRSPENSGFDRLEVRLQIKLFTLLFLRTPSSVWSISTAYSYLLREYSPEASIFWSGDLFDPVREYSRYKDFDLLLCLTPPAFDKVPDSFAGKKMHFNMCCDLSIFQACSTKKPLNSLIIALQEKPKSSPIAGYVGTLSDRRIDYSMLTSVVEQLPRITFVLVGKGDETSSTYARMNEIRKYQNVHIIEDLDYSEMPTVIRAFSICIVPYRLNDANLGTCPNKFIEYCAIGKPIVSTPLPGLTKFPGLAFFAESANEFARNLATHADNFDDVIVQHQQKLAKESTAENFLKRFEKAICSN